MNQERLYEVLRMPHVSEKTTLIGDKNNVITFKVAVDASKPEIKQAVEKLFNVAVESVRTLNVKPKKKRFGQIMGKRSGWKKAYVKLSEGQDLDFAGIQ